MARKKKKGYVVTFGRHNIPKGRMMSTSKVYRTKSAAIKAKNRFKRLFSNPRVKKAR